MYIQTDEYEGTSKGVVLLGIAICMVIILFIIVTIKRFRRHKEDHKEYELLKTVRGCLIEEEQQYQ